MKQIISFEKEIPFKTMVGEIKSISLEHTLEFQDDSSIAGDFIVSGTYKLTEASRLEEPFSYKVPVDILLTESLEKDTRSVDIENFTYEILNEEALRVKIDLAVEGEEKEKEETEEIEQEDVETFEEKQEEVEETVQEEEDVEEVFQEPKEEVEVLTVEQEENKNEQELRQEVLETKQEESTLTENKVLSAKENIDKVSEQTQENVQTVLEDDKETSKEVMHSIFSVFKDADETFSTYSVYILREEDTLDEVLNRYHISKEEASLYNNLEELHVGSKLILPTVIPNE